MIVGRFPLLGVLVLALSGILSGCANPGPIATRRNTVGMLKASVSQLEYANDNLKKQVATLESESTRFENELVQQRDANGELTARLDDAKNVIRDRGGDITALNRPVTTSPSRPSTSTVGDEIPPPENYTPIRRSRTARKSPTTQLPRADSSSTSGWDTVDPGPHAFRDGGDDDGRWLPVVRAPGRSGGTIIR